MAGRNKGHRKFRIYMMVFSIKHGMCFYRSWKVPAALTAVQFVCPILAVFHTITALPIGDTLLHLLALKFKAAAVARKTGRR